MISIGLVCEDGREYYAINEDCDFSKANDWVKENVISQLAPRWPVPVWEGGSPRIWEESKAWTPLKIIRSELLTFLGVGLGDTCLIEMWGECCAYDYVVFSQLMGKDFNRKWWHLWRKPRKPFGLYPSGFPYHINDIEQLRIDIDPEIKLPEQASEKHNALNDARHVKKCYSFLMDYRQKMSDRTPIDYK